MQFFVVEEHHDFCQQQVCYYCL